MRHDDDEHHRDDAYDGHPENNGGGTRVAFLPRSRRRRERDGRRECDEGCEPHPLRRCASICATVASRSCTEGNDRREHRPTHEVCGRRDGYEPRPKPTPWPPSQPNGCVRLHSLRMPVLVGIRTRNVKLGSCRRDSVAPECPQRSAGNTSSSVAANPPARSCGSNTCGSRLHL
jgi:hypothetical protein